MRAAVDQQDVVDVALATRQAELEAANAERDATPPSLGQGEPVSRLRTGRLALLLGAVRARVQELKPFDGVRW